MSDDPVRSLIKNLGTRLSQIEHSDIVFNNSGGGKQFRITPEKFVEIEDSEDLRKIAFVDGGNGLLEESPNYVITINRIYFSMFRGWDRIRPKCNPRIQFFSYMTSKIETTDGKKKVSYDTRLFPYSEEDKKYLPNEKDMSSVTERNASVLQQDSDLTSLGRKFAEWQIAMHVVEEELEKGDILVMDGSLQTTFKNESKYADRLCQMAVKKGVIVCGLSKTSRLITESGAPLLARIAEIAEKVEFDKWYVKVSSAVSSDDRGFMLAIKLHPKSEFVYRFEILREQFDRMEPSEINAILYSLATNSQDVAMIGYPYGAIDTDRFAQIRMNELGMYKGFMISEMFKIPEWKKLQRYSASVMAHDILNRVTS